MSKIALVSADSHAGLKRGDYFEYMEKKYHDDLSAYVKAKGKEVSLAEERFQRYLAGAEDKKLVEAMVAEKEARERYAVDLASRIEACDQDGFVAEVLFPDASAENEIPFTGLLGGTSGYSAELRSAALRAYNRWLGENCEPERQLGLAVFDTDDPEAALAEIEAARGPGLLGVLPQWDGNDDEALEPVWAACAAEGLAVHFHVGSGLPGNVGENSLATGFRGLIAGGEMVYWCRRPLWHFIWSGILDRYPDLKLVFAESFADWIPRTLGHLDWQWESVRTRGQETVPMRPSEYWARQGYVCAHTASLEEWKLRHEIGLDKLMYGTNFPRAGSPWRKSTEFLQATVGNLDIPETEARAILGENAIRLYDLDMAKIGPVIDRIGRRSEEVLNVAATTEEILSGIRPFVRMNAGRPFSM